MRTEVCIFNGNEVSFSLDKENNMMVNATEMAKSGNSRFLEEDLIVSKQKSGTWMHRILALKFAAWLNPEFN
jgi:phosphatidylserine/phosphatidylglycerophosphate/cardiolipin synthase-like enzyme